MTKKSRNFTIEEDILEKIINAAEEQGLSCSALMEKAAKAWLDKHENSETSTLTEAQVNEIEKLMREELEESCFKNKEELSSKSKLTANFDFDDEDENFDSENLNLSW